MVLNARFFSAYKGKLVIRGAGRRGRSFSIGMMFISPKLKAGDQFAIATVRHEFGHTQQLGRLGLIRYIKYIAIPSMRSDPYDPDYYVLPWEITADIFGGAGRPHSDEEKRRGEAYLDSIAPKRLK